MENDEIRMTNDDRMTKIPNPNHAIPGSDPFGNSFVIIERFLDLARRDN